MQERLDVLQKHLKKIDDVISKGVYKDNWESLAFHKVPDWYRNSKLGIFIHWGVYSVRHMEMSGIRAGCTKKETLSMSGTRRPMDH